MWQYYPLNSRSNNDFLHNSGLSGCYLGGNVRDVEKNRDNPRWKRANPARWVLGISLFHSHWHEALSFFFKFKILLFLFVRACVLFQRGGKSPALLWEVDKAECIGLACLEFVTRNFWVHVAPPAHLFPLWKHCLVTVSINPYVLDSPKLEWSISSLFTTL